MPIYAYRCGICGHAKDVLQKLSDAPLHTCPACGAEAFSKQVTAAGFQLKGSGWYVTDFRGGSGGTSAPASAGGAGAAGDTSSGSSSTSTSTSTSTSSESGGSSASGGGDTSSGGASASCGGGCACH